MSSHHIVREKQEPALLVLDLDGFSFERLGQLLEWSPTVLATAGTYPVLEGRQIKVDVLFAEGLPPAMQTHLKIISSSGDHLHGALQYLVTEGYPAVNIVTDDVSMLAGMILQFASVIDIVAYTNTEKSYPVRSGFSKWVPAGEQIRLLNTPKDFTYTGIKKITEAVYEAQGNSLFKLHFTDSVILITEVNN